MATEKYDAIAKAYDDRYAGPRWDLYDHVTLATAGPYLPAKGGRVLDAGAGTGKFSVALLARGHRVTLLDPSAEMLEVARRKVQERLPGATPEFVTGSIEKLEFPDGAFDAVFCEGDPLSYCVSTHREAAREIVRVLAPGGGFYVSCDSRGYAALMFAALGRPDLMKACVEKGSSFDPYGVPVHAFTPSELRGVFEEAGATDVRVTGKICATHLLPDARFETLVGDEDSRRAIYALEESFARDPSAAMLGGHLHVVGRKPA